MYSVRNVAALVAASWVLVQIADAQVPNTTRQIPHAQHGAFGNGQASAYPRPTVSPYLHLTNQPLDANGNPRFAGIYQTQVRPQLEQRQFAMDQEREIARIEANVMQLQNRLGGGSAPLVPRTGHSSRFMNMSHYYRPTQR